MDTPTQVQAHRDYGFVVGLMAGTFVGAGLALWLAPKSTSELRERMKDSANGLRDRASERYDQVRTRVGEAVDEITRTGLDVRDDVATVVARGANTVERYANAAKSDRPANTHTSLAG